MALACSFCGSDANEARRLVATEAGTAAICEACTHAVLDRFAAADFSESAIELTPAGRQVAPRLTAEGCR